MEILQENNIQEHNINNSAEDHDFAGKWKKQAAFFLSGQALSLFGTAVVQYAIIWFLTLSTKSGAVMTVAAICGFLPQILVSLYAGVWADRHNRKKIIIISDAAIAFSTLIFAITLMTGYKELWLFYLALAVRSTGSGIQNPAVSAVIPQLVPPVSLLKINGINQSIQSTIMILAPIASGALLSLSSLQWVFFLDVATALIAIALLAPLKIRLHKGAEVPKETSVFYEFKEGLKYVRTHTFMRSLLILYLIFFFLVTPVAMLTPLMVARTFGGEVWRLTLNEISFFGGSTLGGFIFAAWGGFKNRVHTIALSCIAFGILTIGLGLPIHFYFYLGIMLVTGLFMPAFNVPAMTLIQEKVEENMQGRVFSLISIIASAMIPFGMLLFGPAAEIVKIEYLLLGTGALMTIQGAAIFLNKKFLNEGL